jgi:acylglycerol lipase
LDLGLENEWLSGKAKGGGRRSRTIPQRPRETLLAGATADLNAGALGVIWESRDGGGFLLAGSIAIRPDPPREVTIVSADGTALAGSFWRRPSPRGVLVISHGLGEHAGCYQHVVEALWPRLEVEILAFDYRGHGRSPGRRGLVARYDDLVADLQSALAWVANERPGLPRFVLGHSNGALVLIRASLAGLMVDLAGQVLSNPALRLARPVPWYKRLAASVLPIVAPGVTLETGLASDEMTRDPEMLAQRDADPLRHSRISAPLFFGMARDGPLIAQRASEIRTPTLLVLSEADRVIDGRESRAFFERLASPDKTLRIYPGMLHEPLNDLGRAQVIADIADWITTRLDHAAEQNGQRA